MLTASAPAQLTIVAGTLATSSIFGSWRAMSSSWIGLKRFGRVGCSGIGAPALMNARCHAGQPPLSPYGTLRRAIVVGTSYRRAAARATASAAILAMLYVGIMTRWLSPSGSEERRVGKEC